MRSLLYAANGRIRAPFRLFLFLAAAFVAAFLLSQLIALAGPSIPIGVRGDVFGLVLPAALLIAHAFSIHVVERGRGWSLVGLHDDALRPRAVGFGAGLGALAIGVPTLVLLMARQFSIVAAPDGSWLWATIHITAVLIPAALWEELLFRGYPFAVLRETIGWKSTLLVTSVAFGLAHLQNGGADFQNIVIVVTAGFFLGMVLLATRSLYAAWAAHFAWNWVMACGFHVSVSGNPFERPDYEMVARGAAWLTGGVWGPEGGVGAAVGLFAAVFYVYGRYLKPVERQARL